MRKHFFGLGNKILTELFFPITILQDWEPVPYEQTKPDQDSFEMKVKGLFSTPGIKGWATSGKKTKGTEKRGRVGMEMKGRISER